jgi:hypothetical protein
MVTKTQDRARAAPKHARVSLRREVEILPPVTEEDKMLSGLVYPAWFVAPFFVLASPKREDPFLHFHALQALLFGALSCVAGFVLMLALWVTMRIIPVN